MRIRYPKSFLKLLLVGFAFAILPLIFAFINANIAFNQLSQQSQTTIAMAVQATRSSLVLQEQLHLMERSARQYFVLGDIELLANYGKARASLLSAVKELSSLSTKLDQLEKLKALEASVEKIHARILNTQDETDKNLNFLNEFNTLSNIVDDIILENNANIDASSQHLKIKTSKTQSQLFLQSLILIPFALIVAGIIAYMLGRPIQRMDTAIEDLGKGDYLQEISIDGPGDLRILGQRLDWLRQELLNLKEQKQLFLQHISHELKTPLTAIREAAELLTDGVGGQLNSQQSEITHILKDNSIRLQKMIENLLNFTKMESSKQVLNIRSVNMQDLINKTLDSHALSIRNKRLNIHTSFLSEQMKVDQEKLIIIIDNLISNAVKFTPSNGVIEISTKLDKQWQMIEVKDNGPGLSKEDADKLFDSFYQGKTLHQGLVNSSGLGLAIAKNLTEIHQGKLELVKSETGAHFLLRLPH